MTAAAPYLLISDLHCHAWSAFSTTDADGVNSRLKGIVDELRRACDVLSDLGGYHVVIAGDLFHTRGSIDPEVFNYVHAAFENLILQGFSFHAIPGNHDLKGRETTELGNAIQSFDGLEGFSVFSEPGFQILGATGIDQRVAMMPWRSDTKALLGDSRALFAELSRAGEKPEEMDLIIHAGIDGVLVMPDHGLGYADLQALGFKRVFAGHYHHHKAFPGDAVFSIGSLTQQKWTDIGTKAGFLIVRPDVVTYQATHEPCFVEITGDTDFDDIPIIVDGNYVRVSGMKLSDADIKQYRGELEEMGARGILFQVTRETVSARTGVTLKSKTLEEAVVDYVDGLGLAASARVLARSNEILSKAQEKAA